MIKIAQTDDLSFVKELWLKCFDDSKEYTDTHFAHNFKPKNTIIAVSGGTSAAAMQIIPYIASFLGESLPIRYVSGVSVAPEFRKKGLAREMFEFALPHMYSQNTILSVLYPAVNGMYEKFGYRSICNRYEYSVDANDFCISDLNRNIIADKINKIYKRETKDFSFYTLREQRDLDWLIKDFYELSGGGVIFDGLGYMFVYPNRQNPKKLVAAEVLGIDTNKFSASATYPLMVRIINLWDFLSVCGKLLPEDYAFSVSDDIISENNFSFYINGGKPIKCENGKKTDIAQLCEHIFKKVGKIFVNLLY